MQELQAQLDEDAISVELASPSDARALAKLYASVYRGIYPNPELFTIAGMAELLNFSKSHAYTMKVTCQQEVVAGCTFQLHGRAAYCRGFMVAPQWQGRIRAKQVFDHLLLDAREVLKGKADYFYGELRTEAAKVQSIAEGVGMRPFALLPRKDIFHGKRESEVIYAWFYAQPVIRPLVMTRASARMASVVLGGMVPCFDP
ncbi:MAG TPA: hypothetical protein VKK79_00630, partial [Candidatus Lokiarchaeia archaeon]|nr:hypothetical protein [Candidatus Lokiarchaeia archaeon]